ncbi:MAG: 3-dehydroquinate synthase [Anaerolineae bacterium]|nr:3-dehydroquinate synthase [Anaerolineae bacterium]
MNRNLVLAGFMGVGKTSVGRAVAQHLGWPFIDMDEVIEARAGKSISRIFSEDGEPAFRELEAALCRELGARRSTVIATGGGALVDPDSRAALSAASTLVCLGASTSALVDRVHGGAGRPLLGVEDLRADIEHLLSGRREAYAAIPWQIDTTDRALADVVAEVAALAAVHSLPVAHPTGTYDIHIGSGTLRYLGGVMRAAGIGEGSRVVVVSNDVVAPLWAGAVSDSLEAGGLTPIPCVIPDGETHKTLETVRALYDALLQADLDRHDTVLALGGGVTGDVVGFAAATYMRGVRLVQVPTSLLAMTDASVGAKTGVDLPQGKNLVGVFKQPELVFIDLAVLATLPGDELRSGLAEVIKHGVIGDPALFEELADLAATGAPVITPQIMARSIQVKIDIVQEDPLENGRRAVLNLGHTVGHAIEMLSRYAMRHGDAVAIGMVAASRISEMMGRAEAGLGDRVSGVLASAGLPTSCPPWYVGEVLRAMRHDKKRQGRRLRWVLPRAIGCVELADDVPETLVSDVLIGMGAHSPA